MTDGMLGKLSRFLRILGYDTIYANDLEDFFDINPVPDENLINFAKENDRILLTKDYQLHRSFIDNSIYLEGEGVYNYLIQLKGKLSLDFIFNIEKARCSICNSELKKVEDKNLIKELVLKNTFDYYNEFFQCVNSQCKKIYWYGTHIIDIISKLKKNLDSD
ncbi:MAG: Mut7-C RNAse domain-containing protein [Promethearchaeota archaeon]